MIGLATVACRFHETCRDKERHGKGDLFLVPVREAMSSCQAWCAMGCRLSGVPLDSPFFVGCAKRTWTPLPALTQTWRPGGGGSEGAILAHVFCHGAGGAVAKRTIRGWGTRERPDFPRNSRCVRNCSQSDVRGLAARGTNLLPWCASAAIAQGVLSCCVCLCRGASSAQQGSATAGVLAIAPCRGCAVVIGRAVVSASRAPSPIRPYPCNPRNEQALCSPRLVRGRQPLKRKRSLLLPALLMGGYPDVLEGVRQA